MLVTLAAVIFFASIFVFFSQEFIRTFKKIFAIKAVALFLPLLIASWLIFTFVHLFLWTAYYYREMLQAVLTFLVYLMPFHQQAKSLAMIILLTVISVLPVILIDLFVRQRTYQPYKYPYLTSTIIWIVNAELLLVTVG